MSSVLLKGGRVIDPSSGDDGKRDVLVVDGKLAALGSSSPSDTRDVSGCWVCPALTDLRCVLRGDDDLSDALAGGFVRVVADPSSKGVRGGVIEVLVASELARGAELIEPPANAVCLSSGFAPLASLGLLRRALQYADQRLIMLHAEDPTLSAGAVLGEGLTALRLGLPGSPSEAETAAVAAALAVLEGSGGRLHLSHLTCRGSVERVAAARRAGLSVTADVTPHHLLLDDGKAEGFALEGRVWPPLRSRADIEALRRAVIDGTIDAVATDHKRTTVLEREHPFEQAAWGKTAFKTAFADVVTAGVPPPRAVALFTSGPAAVLGLDAPSLQPGARADLAVFDPTAGRMRYTLVQGAFR